MWQRGWAGSQGLSERSFASVRARAEEVIEGKGASSSRCSAAQPRGRLWRARSSVLFHHAVLASCSSVGRPRWPRSLRAGGGSG
jgi:hypothetical protein